MTNKTECYFVESEKCSEDKAKQIIASTPEWILRLIEAHDKQDMENVRPNLTVVK